MSLLRRTANNTNNNNNGNANNNAQPLPTNPANQNANPPAPAPANNNQPAPQFGRAPATTNRFGAATNANTNPVPAKSWRYEGIVNRFGASDVAWVIAPIDTAFVRFDLKGLGDPFYRLFGKILDLNNADPATLAQTIRGGGDAVDDLNHRLDEAWDAYHMQGAAMVYTWNDHIKEIIAAVPEMMKNTFIPNPFDETANINNNQTPVSGMCLRSIDMLLVLNVLGRTKSNILLGNGQLILEEGFITRSLVTNDPRLVALAQATGCIEEQFTK